MRFKKNFWIGLLLFLVLFLAACGNTSDGEYSEGNSNDGIVVETSRKVYYTVNVDIECDNLSTSIDKFNNETIKLSGYVSKSSINERNAIVTYRIPTDKLEQFLNLIESDENSELMEKNVKATDVTSTYNEIEARLEVLKASRKAYLNILEKAENISDIIAINTRIEEIDSEILKLENEKSSYDNLVAYSTITINFIDKQGNHFFADYGDYLVGLFKVIGIVILYLLPFAIIGGVLVFVIVFISKRNMKKNASFKEEEKEKNIE